MVRMADQTTLTRFTSCQHPILSQLLKRSGATHHRAIMAARDSRWLTLFTRLVSIHHVTQKPSALAYYVVHISSALTTMVGSRGAERLMVLKKQTSGRRLQILRPNKALSQPGWEPPNIFQAFCAHKRVTSFPHAPRLRSCQNFGSRNI